MPGPRVLLHHIRQYRMHFDGFLDVGSHQYGSRWIQWVDATGAYQGGIYPPLLRRGARGEAGEGLGVRYQYLHGLLDIPDRRADTPDPQRGPQPFQSRQGQLHLHTALTSQQLVPLISNEPIQLLEEIRRAFAAQHHMQAFGRGHQQMRQYLLLRGALLGAGIAGACTNLPIEAHAVTHALCAFSDLVRQCS